MYRNLSACNFFEKSKKSAKIVKVGVNYSSEQKQLTEWVIE